MKMKTTSYFCVSNDRNMAREDKSVKEYSDNAYGEMIDALFRRFPSFQNAGASAYKPGIDNMLFFDMLSGHPHRKYRTIHIAGTNGKGSVANMLASVLAACGLRTGLYTSPHISDFRERRRIIDGRKEADTAELITTEEVWDFVQQWNSTFDHLNLSFFEITTMMAFDWFAKREVDIAVIETGLGGRLDSTNIITPELCVITSIGLDHCAMLGDTRAKIAAEKAGIFKPGVPAVVATEDWETARVFERRAAEVHCPLFFADSYPEPEFGLDLHGPYQTENLHTVLFALGLLGEGADHDAISRAAEITGLRGRWERLPGLPETICDIGHNPAALRINFDRLESTGRPLFIVFGIMADKDIASILPLMPRRARYFCVAPAIPRSLSAERLGELMQGFDHVVCGSVAEGVREARREASKTENGMVYVGGSNFVVAECISSLDEIEKPTV